MVETQRGPAGGGWVQWGGIQGKGDLEEGRPERTRGSAGLQMLQREETLTKAKLEGQNYYYHDSKLLTE